MVFEVRKYLCLVYIQAITTMQRILVLLCVGGRSLSVAAQAPSLREKLLAGKITLPNGWSLTPAGRSLRLGDLPLNIAVSSSRRYLAVTNNGQSTQTIQLIDAEKERVLDSVIIPKSWLGLAFSADDKYLYASGGNDNRILKYAVNPEAAEAVGGDTVAGAGSAGGVVSGRGVRALVLVDSILLGKNGRKTSHPLDWPWMTGMGSFMW